MVFDIILQIIGGVNGNPVDCRVNYVRRYIERGVHRESGAFKGEVIQNGAAQITNADNNQMIIIINTQNVTDFGSEFFYIITIALLAELAKAAEILADLRGSDPHFLSQRMRRCADDASGAKFV